MTAEINAWLRAVADWMKADPGDPAQPPPAPAASLARVLAGRHGINLGSDCAFAVCTELQQTRTDLTAAREAIRVLLGEAGLDGLGDLTTVDGRSVVDIVRRGMGVGT